MQVRQTVVSGNGGEGPAGSLWFVHPADGASPRWQDSPSWPFQGPSRVGVKDLCPWVRILELHVGGGSPCGGLREGVTTLVSALSDSKQHNLMTSNKRSKLLHDSPKHRVPIPPWDSKILSQKHCPEIYDRKIGFFLRDFFFWEDSEKRKTWFSATKRLKKKTPKRPEPLRNPKNIFWSAKKQ